jgi:hypothetical protein
MSASPSPPSPLLMRRLSLVRYLYEAGVEQSRKSPAVSCLAILSFHDATELFLRAAADHLKADLKRNAEFLDYWAALEVRGVKLGRKDRMSGLNRARVSLKHMGLRTAHPDVEEFREMVRAFLEDEFPPVFGLRLGEASLASLVKSDTVRPLLLEAEQAARDADYNKAVEAAARAFRLTLREHAQESELVRPGLRQPMFLNLFGVYDIDRRLEAALEDMSEDFGEQITVLAHHLDYDGYLYLKTFGPPIHEFPGGQLLVEEALHRPNLTDEIARRCVDFAVDAALTLEDK